MDQTKIDTFVEAVTTWCSSKQTSSVKIILNKSPDKHPGDDYEIVWEVAFQPESLEKASLEVSITSDGDPAVGIERWQRIATRLGVQCSADAKIRYAAGFEPKSSIQPGLLLSLCDAVSEGRFKIIAYIFLGRLVGCDIAIENTILCKLQVRLSPSASMLRFLSKIYVVREVYLAYENWNSPD